MTFTAPAESTALFLESAVILQGKNQVGEFGQLSPVLAKKYDLARCRAAGGIESGFAAARRNPAKSFKPLPAFPAIRRDVAMMVPEATTHERRVTGGEADQTSEPGSRELFDVFRGKNVPTAKRA